MKTAEEHAAENHSGFNLRKLQTLTPYTRPLLAPSSSFGSHPLTAHGPATYHNHRQDSDPLPFRYRRFIESEYFQQYVSSPALLSGEMTIRGYHGQFPGHRPGQYTLCSQRSSLAALRAMRPVEDDIIVSDRLRTEELERTGATGYGFTIDPCYCGLFCHCMEDDYDARLTGLHDYRTTSCPESKGGYHVVEPESVCGISRRGYQVELCPMESMCETSGSQKYGTTQQVNSLYDRPSIN